MPKTVLQFKNAWYKYLGVKEWILKNINLKIPQNSFFVLTGPTGSGKSTLLTLARGFYKEYGGKFSGEIFILGENIKKFSISELGARVGIIFQDPASQLHQLRVIDEIRSGPMYQGLPWEECKKRADELAGRIIGEEFFKRPPAELSSGEQQKVALAACISMKCEILLLDEPFSFLDVKAAEEILNILLELKKGGKTVVLATHNLEQVAGYADRIALINNGKLILEGPTEEILYSNELEEVLTSPLAIKVAKALIGKKKLEEKVVNWQNLLEKISINSKNRRIIKDEKIIKNEVKQDTILKLNNVSYRYPESTKGVKDISLDIYRGEILGIIGPNGSGKTTLAKLILGLLKPNKGEIYLFGKKITKVETSERAKQIGYVTQDPTEMLFEDTVLEECAFGPKCFGLENPQQLAKEMLNKLGLLRYKEEHPDSLSGGERRLLTIADILVNKPRLLILDEPEFGLDPKTWRSIANTIKKFKKQGETIILITHNLEITIFLCDRIAVMDKSRILAVEEPIKLYTNTELLQKSNLLPSLPFFKAFKVLDKDKKSFTEENFIDSLIASTEEIK